jgi:hypothetical protein
VGTAAALAATGRLDRPAIAGPEGHRSPRPWWGNPLVWLGVSAVFVFLGLVVAPRLFGGIFLFLPLIWLGRSRRRRSC